MRLSNPPKWKFSAPLQTPPQCSFLHAYYADFSTVLHVCVWFPDSSVAFANERSARRVALQSSLQNFWLAWLTFLLPCPLWLVSNHPQQIWVMVTVCMHARFQLTENCIVLHSTGCLAVFIPCLISLPRDATQSAVMLQNVVRLSVRQSACLWRSFFTQIGIVRK